MRAIVLAGGKGTRLRPYTTVFPKPLVPIGDVPILEVVIRQLASHGFTKITLAVGHLAGLIEAFFQDGSRFGVEIDYSLEDKPLGTAGPISLISNLDEDFLVMNGDELTTLSYSELIRQHRQEKAAATIAVHTKDMKVNLGVLELTPESMVSRYIEKPTYTHRVSMGIYIFSPRILEHIPHNEHMDFPDLIQILLDRKEKVFAYQSTDYWLDIGRHSEYQEAVEEFEAKKHLFLPE